MGGTCSLAYCVSAKIKRSIKTSAIVGLIVGSAMLGARPFIAMVESPPPLDPAPATFADYESEHHPYVDLAESDSDREQRARQPIERTLQVGKGETLAETLNRAGVDISEAKDAVASLNDVFDPKNLKAGQDVTIKWSTPPDGLGRGAFTTVSFSPDPVHTLTVSHKDDVGFVATENKRQVTREIAHYSGAIKVSLFDSAMSAGVPTAIIGAMIKTLSYDVDFQRDLQAGDSFDVMFEGYYDSKGHLVRSGDMLFASVTLAGKPIAMYRFEDQQGTIEYFNDRGETLKKALLRTPVDGARITSGYGMRLHPLLGYTKMHKGIDFGVPAGTPIMAAGDGTIEMAGFNGSYGNYVRIRHANGFGTAYAHMSRISQGIYTGKHVKQGQIIGFVGATGRATGPHLHYEVLSGNNQINPTSAKIPTGVRLAGKDLERFKEAKSRLQGLLVRLSNPSTRLAANPFEKNQQ